jgi:hypothetical protein
MTPFEVFFGLSSVILGLALTEIASSIAKLLRAGRKVRWAPEPILQTILITLIVVSVWADQWWSHEAASFTIGQAVLQVAKLMAVYVAAASVLGEPEATIGVDLKEHYYDARRVTYGAMITGLLLFNAYALIYFPRETLPSVGDIVATISLPAIYLAAAIFRWRPYHLVMLVTVTVLYAMQIFGIVIK